MGNVLCNYNNFVLLSATPIVMKTQKYGQKTINHNSLQVKILLCYMFQLIYRVIIQQNGIKEELFCKKTQM